MKITKQEINNVSYTELEELICNTFNRQDFDLEVSMEGDKGNLDYMWAVTQTMLTTDEAQEVWEWESGQTDDEPDLDVILRALMMKQLLDPGVYYINL